MTKLTVLVFLLIQVLLGFAAVGGTTVYVNSTFKGIPATGSLSNPCKSLRCGLLAATFGDIISIAPGIYSGTSNDNLCNLTKACPHSFTLYGNGPPESIIIQSTSVNLRAINILNRTLVKMYNLTFQHFSLNQAINVNRALVTAGIPNGGGAITAAESNLELTNVRFIRNTAAVGGALRAVDNTNLTISNCYFEGNKAAVFGGGLLAQDSTVVISRSKFITNSAIDSLNLDNDGSGGAVYGLGSFRNHFHIFNTEFHNNTAGENGGAVYIRSISSSQSVFHGSELIFSQNSVYGHGNCFSLASCDSSGGALYLDVASVNISHCNFTGNTANTEAPNSVCNNSSLSILVCFVVICCVYLLFICFNCVLTVCSRRCVVHDCNGVHESYGTVVDQHFLH